ncbi:MAG: hypothetical protein ABL962_10190, partial [Fimbriimonadaceae bacterium]
SRNSMRVQAADQVKRALKIAPDRQIAQSMLRKMREDIDPKVRESKHYYDPWEEFIKRHP